MPYNALWGGLRGKNGRRGALFLMGQVRKDVTLTVRNLGVPNLIGWCTIPLPACSDTIPQRLRHNNFINPSKFLCPAQRVCDGHHLCCNPHWF